MKTAIIQSGLYLHAYVLLDIIHNTYQKMTQSLNYLIFDMFCFFSWAQDVSPQNIINF